MMSEEVRIYVRHVRAAGFCLSGLRAYADSTGTPLRDFVKEGVLASTFVGSKDPNIIRVIEIATLEHRDGR